MPNYNRIILIGNLTRDVTLRYLPNQTAVADFGIAVNHKFKTKSGEERDEAMFVDCVIWGKGAEIVNQYCQKGKQLMVEGRLKLDVWEDKNGGGKRSKHTVVVENFQFLGGRDGAKDGEKSAAPSRQSQSAPAKAAPAPPYGDEQQFQEDDIPF